MTEEKFDALLREVPTFIKEQETITEDVRPGRSNEKWLNVFLRKPER
jgi:hypothetical protein